MVEQNGLMKTNRVFFLLCFLLLDVAVWNMLWVWGTSFMPCFCCAVLLSAVQAQVKAACCMMSVFIAFMWNHLLLHFVTGHLKGPLSVRQELPAPCQAPLLPQRPRHQHAPLLLYIEKALLYGAWETEEKVHAIQHPPLLQILPDLAPCPAASLLPLVYFLFLIRQK